MDALNDSLSNSITSSHVKRITSLYIICEKSQLKSLKGSELNKDRDNSFISFIPVDVHEVKDTKNSFKKLCKACVPSAAQNDIDFQSQDLKEVQQGLESRGSLQHTSSFGSKSKPANNFRRSSHKKFSRLNNGFNGINQFNTNINYNYSLTANAHSNQAGQLSSSAVGFHKLLNDSKWFEQLQVNMINQININTWRFKKKEFLKTRINLLQLEITLDSFKNLLTKKFNKKQSHFN